MTFRTFMNLNFNLKNSRVFSESRVLNKFNKMEFRTTPPLMQKDFYKTLGVGKNATKDEIKKAYFTAAKKFHPDVNKSPDAKEKFAEINTAYETLGDEQKRRIYDQTGMTGDEQAQAGAGPGGPFDGGFPGFGGFGGPGGPGGPGGFWENFGGQNNAGGMPGGGSFRDIFEDFESFFNMGQNKKGGDSRASSAVKGKDVTLNVEIEFMEAVNGAQKSVTYNKVDNCSR